MPWQVSPGHHGPAGPGQCSSPDQVLSQVLPGPGPARSRKAQPKPGRACLGQHLADPVGSGTLLDLGAGFLALRTKKTCVDEFSSNADKAAEPYLSYDMRLFFAGFKACVRKNNALM